MSDRRFLDTNILVYSFDASAPAKRRRSRKIIAGALGDGSGIISYQVVQEFLNVALHKFASPFSVKDCHDYLTSVLEPLCQVYSDTELYRKALEIHNATGFSFYNSLIVAGAIRGGCSQLLTEDMQEGRKLEGVSLVNPFLT